MIRELTYREAIASAIGDELEADPRTVFFGEDVGAAGGAFKSTVGLLERFGGERVRDTPISEQAIVGAAIGAAIAGLRPIAEIMFADFVGVCFDQIVNQLAKYRYMTAGQVRLPVTLRMANGAGAGFGAQHSQAAENWLINVPGLYLATPATAEDTYRILRTAVQCDDPVVVFEHKNLFGLKGTIDSTAPVLPVGKADVVRSGEHVTVVATQQMRHRAVEAAEELAAEGIHIEVIDPRWLTPFDDAAVVASLQKTSRLLVVQEGPAPGGWAGALVARLCAHHFELFDAPPRLLTSPFTPVPYSGVLEDAWLPSAPDVADCCRELLKY
ncbi:MAG: alpha-ketoacid dehydrogenase subunit beta [Actinomycetota bacterium]|nr:alpha-ketoacid dehydrogenase subunit beta [Actinomycetota bacterium]